MQICKACGKPIKVNKDSADVFEGMHWLCFHLLFEHDNYDPDEPCDDPDCPWNRISGKSIMISNSYSDIKIESIDNKCGIYLNVSSIIQERLASLECELTLVDEYIREYKRTIWIEKEKLQNFRNELLHINMNCKGNASFITMSPNDLIINVLNVDKLGHIALSYEITKQVSVESYRKQMNYTNMFEIDINTISKLIKNIDDVLTRFH